MSESVGQPVVPHRDTDERGAAGTAVRSRPGAGRPGRVSLGWTEILVAIVAFLALSTAAGFTLGADGLRDTTVMLLVGSGSFLLAALIALAVRVRWLPAIGVRSTTWRWLLAGLGVGILMRGLAIGLVFG